MGEVTMCVWGLCQQLADYSNNGQRDKVYNIIDKNIDNLTTETFAVEIVISIIVLTEQEVNKHRQVLEQFVTKVGKVELDFRSEMRLGILKTMLS